MWFISWRYHLLGKKNVNKYHYCTTITLIFIAFIKLIFQNTSCLMFRTSEPPVNYQRTQYLTPGWPYSWSARVSSHLILINWSHILNPHGYFITLKSQSCCQVLEQTLAHILHHHQRLIKYEYGILRNPKFTQANSHCLIKSSSYLWR